MRRPIVTQCVSAILRDILRERKSKELTLLIDKEQYYFLYDESIEFLKKPKKEFNYHTQTHEEIVRELLNADVIADFELNEEFNDDSQEYNLRISDITITSNP
jgi:hypothetical protein